VKVPAPLHGHLGNLCELRQAERRIPDDRVSLARDSHVARFARHLLEERTIGRSMPEDQVDVAAMEVFLGSLSNQAQFGLGRNLR